MELKEAIQSRASVRQFVREAVPKEDLMEMARLAGLAPSPNNQQPWRFVVVTDPGTLECMANAVRDRLEEVLPKPSTDEGAKARTQVEWFSTFFVDAPAVIAVAVEPYEAVVDKALANSSLTHEAINQLRMYPDIQCIGACIQNLLLAAADMGYAGCWLSGPMVAREEIESCIDIQAPCRLAAMVAVGRPATTPKQKPKKPVEEIIRFLE